MKGVGDLSVAPDQGDIVANWPEDDWPRLMRCRLLFGIRG